MHQLFFYFTFLFATLEVKPKIVVIFYYHVQTPQNLHQNNSLQAHLCLMKSGLERYYSITTIGCKAVAFEKKDIRVSPSTFSYDGKCSIAYLLWIYD